jgi:hypothetical protein
MGQGTNRSKTMKSHHSLPSSVRLCRTEEGSAQVGDQGWVAVRLGTGRQRGSVGLMKCLGGSWSLHRGRLAER